MPWRAITLLQNFGSTKILGPKISGPKKYWIWKNLRKNSKKKFGSKQCKDAV